MPKLIDQAKRITAAGNKPKLIDEFIGRANSDEARLSVAHMRSPGGWIEPGQRPDFDEFTLVLEGTLRVQHEKGSMDVRAGQAVVTNKGEWVRYSTPFPEGAEYIAVCLPAFSMESVHRDAERPEETQAIDVSKLDLGEEGDAAAAGKE
jgi:mannose-6-phosphate isomerase-like protein (cupin superfamily)